MAEKYARIIVSSIMACMARRRSGHGNEKYMLGVSIARGCRMPCCIRIHGGGISPSNIGLML